MSLYYKLNSFFSIKNENCDAKMIFPANPELICQNNHNKTFWPHFAYLFQIYFAILEIHAQILHQNFLHCKDVYISDIMSYWYQLCNSYFRINIYWQLPFCWILAAGDVPMGSFVVADVALNFT